MKIGVSSYSFARYVNDGREDIFGVVRLARELGFEGIEFIGPHLGGNNSEALENARKVRDVCAEIGIPIIALTVGADFLKGDWRDEAERIKGEVRVAEALGAPCMRHDIASAHPSGKKGLIEFIDVLPVLAQACRAVTEYAADLGVRTTTENHGYFAQASERCEMLMSRVDHPNFGALVDIGNFLCVDEDPVSAVTRMAPYAFHAHAKDFHTKPACANPGKGWFRTSGQNWLRGSIIGHGDVDIPGCLRALKSGGYDGFVSIEFEGMEDNRQALEIGRENLANYIQAAG